MTAEQVARLTGVDTGCGGITIRPAAGCAQQLTAELLALARHAHCTMVIPSKRSARRAMAGCSISASSGGGSGERPPHHWFAQTAQLPVYPVGGRQPYSPHAACRLRRAVLRRLPDATESAKSAALHWRQLPPRENRHHLQRRRSAAQPATAIAASGRRWPGTWISAPTTLAAECAARSSTDGRQRAGLRGNIDAIRQPPRTTGYRR